MSSSSIVNLSKVDQIKTGLRAALAADGPTIPHAARDQRRCRTMGFFMLGIWPRNVMLPQFQRAAWVLAVTGIVAMLGVLVPMINGRETAIRAPAAANAVRTPAPPNVVRAPAPVVLIPAEIPKSRDEGKMRGEMLVGDYPRDPRARLNPAGRHPLEPAAAGSTRP